MTAPARWLGPLPAMRSERHFGDRHVNCFVERPRSLHTMVAETVRRHGEREALVDGARRWTWQALDTLSAAVAGGLAARGVQRGDRVLLLMANHAGFVIAALALARLGAVAVPVSTRSAPPEVDYVAGQCGATLAIVDEALDGHLPEALPRVAAGALEALCGEASASASTSAAPAAEVDEEDTAVILYTSGTTGRPKGAMLSHLNIVHSALHYEVCMGLGAADRSAVAVPLSHVTGLVAQLWTMVRCGGALVLLEGFKAGAFLRLAAAERVTHTLMVPAMYRLCLLQEDLAAHELSAWRIGAYGGAPMAPATIAQLAEQLPALTLMNAYGATETASPATVMPPADQARRADSVGMAVPCGELQIVDPLDGRVLPAGETGEIWIRGPMVVRGYWDHPQASAEAISEGWWHSGDLGRLDEHGFLQVLDRLKDLINRGGYKVFTSEVEAVLAMHPAVVEAAVVGYACPVLGERVHAHVALRAAATENDLRAFCAARLADYKVPERWTLGLELLPRNANGKLMKRALRERG